MTNGEDRMVHPSAKPYEWTYAEYARFPDDGNRYEVIDGEVLATPAPSTRHQHVAGNLYIRLREYVERHDLGYVLFDVDLLFRTGQFLRPEKPARYGDFGVPEYWVADPAENVVWVWDFHAGGEAVRQDDRAVWQPDPDVPPLDLALAEIFAPL